MSVNHRNHLYKSPIPTLDTWEREYVKWMKMRDRVREFYKKFPVRR